ncbi:hypothetical protein EJ06DRAFT_571836 [Trichodelitschia bisporula]|uniref:Uncharacterized protein n=1 Tax=Trichodelitschia bisporula TaxID=703511 RepID=A0A6G1I5J8_9PEZI|nr:hypothetical protein EJ06DRAFT_571836 [Trichodelitschia bisporula]
MHFSNTLLVALLGLSATTVAAPTASSDLTKRQWGGSSDCSFFDRLTGGCDDEDADSKPTPRPTQQAQPRPNNGWNQPRPNNTPRPAQPAPRPTQQAPRPAQPAPRPATQPRPATPKPKGGEAADDAVVYPYAPNEAAASWCERPNVNRRPEYCSTIVVGTPEAGAAAAAPKAQAGRPQQQNRPQNGRGGNANNGLEEGEAVEPDWN